MLKKFAKLGKHIVQGDKDYLRFAAGFYFNKIIAKLPAFVQTHVSEAIDRHYSSFPTQRNFYTDYILTRKSEPSAYNGPAAKDEKPLVSVITRTYQGRSVLLQQAIRSVALQDYPHIEHIVIEDGGPTYQSLFTTPDDNKQRVHYSAVPKHGRSFAGNAGLRQAQGTYCLFLDDDDLLFHDHVSTLVTALQHQPDCVAAYALSFEVPTHIKPDFSSYTELSHYIPYGSAMPFDPAVLKQRNFLPIHAVLFKRSLFTERGGFQEDLHALEDWDLWQRYARDNHFCYVPKVTSMYRVPGNIVRRAQRQKILSAAHQTIMDKKNLG